MFPSISESSGIPLSITSEDGSPIEWRGLFEPVTKQLDDDNELDHATKVFEVEIFALPLVDGQKPSKIELSGTVRRISQPVPADSVLGYFAPDDPTAVIAKVLPALGRMECGHEANTLRTNTWMPPLGDAVAGRVERVAAEARKNLNARVAVTRQPHPKSIA
jgi:hypothetical protein